MALVECAPDRRGAGAVERAGLENRNTRKRIVGSNPTLSAKPLAFMRVFTGFSKNPIVFPINRRSTPEIASDRRAERCYI